MKFPNPQGLPLLLLIMLWRLREEFNPKDTDEIIGEEEVIANRKEDAKLAANPVARFAMLYRPPFWGMEVYTMVRRLLLTCAVLVCENLAQTMVFVIFVAIVTLVIESETKPYINPFINAFTHVCWCVREPATPSAPTIPSNQPAPTQPHPPSPARTQLANPAFHPLSPTP